MNNVLQTTLAEAVNSLASFFGTTTEAIMEHAPEFLAKYGWYSTLNELPSTIVLSLFTMVLIFIIGLLVTMVFDFDLEIKHPVLVIGGIFILCMVIGVGIKLVTCAVAPEIVGAHAILDLLK